MTFRVTPFTETHLEDAAALVAARYGAERETEPLLPAAFCEPAAVLPRLQRHLERGPGVAAMRDGRLAGFILSIASLHNGAWTAWAPDSAHAADPDDARDIYMPMYAAISERWLASGCFLHNVSILAHDRPALDAWFTLGFGLTLIDGLRDLTPAPGSGTRVDIRRAGPEEAGFVADQHFHLMRHLAAPPVFLPFTDAHSTEAHKRWLSNEANAHWIAYADDEVVGYMSTEPSTEDAIVMPRAGTQTLCMASAFTDPDARKHGTGTALLNHILEWGRAAGYSRCAADFETANIPGSRFWLGVAGFRPVVRSVTRRIDERMAWAHHERPDADIPHR